MALAKLEKQWSQGRKRLAIFYGVGHLPDMAQRLATDFNFHETGTRWLTAWNLGDSPAPAGAAKLPSPPTLPNSVVPAAVPSAAETAACSRFALHFRCDFPY